MESDKDLIESLERVLFLARNKKIKAYAAVYTVFTKAEGDCCELLHIPEGQAVNMAGLTAILHRDVMSRFPDWNDIQEGEIG